MKQSKDKTVFFLQGNDLIRMILIAVLMLSVFVEPLMAQRVQSDNVPNRAMRLFDQSTEHLNWDRFQEAEELLVRAIEIHSGFLEAHFRLGFIYLELHDYEKAETHLEQVISINPQYHSNVYFGLGEATFFNGKHDIAEKAFKQFLTFRVTEERKQHAERRLRSIVFTVDAKQNPVAFDPVKLDYPVTTGLSEYFPVLTADSRVLFFTRMDNDRGFFFENVYIAEKTEGKWDKVRILDPPVNSNENEAVHSISPDGRTIYMTICNRQGNFGTCDLYTSTRTGNRWSRPQNMGPVINSRVWDGHPTISPDGNTLIFASTRSGGYGGQDLWMSERDAGGYWTRPVNLGPEINTDGDEKTPNLHFDNNTLYFTSDGLPGMGGEDIFMSRFEDGKWQKPVNLGYPINSPFNDLGLFVNASGDTAYIASDRFGKPHIQDIYYFVLADELRPNPVSWVRGTIKNKITNIPVEASVEITHLKSGESAAAVISDPSSGEFLIPLPVGDRYAYHVTARGYLFYSENFQVEKTKDGQRLEILLSPVQPGVSLHLRNVFFAHDEYALDPISKIELNRLIDFLNTNPKSKIEIQGHTDNVGNPTYNQKLSEQRALTVKNYLIENGINRARLTSKGYGESNPIAENESEEGRAQNRRTTILLKEN